jgi:hypothetical protein
MARLGLVHSMHVDMRCSDPQPAEGQPLQKNCSRLDTHAYTIPWANSSTRKAHCKGGLFAKTAPHTWRLSNPSLPINLAIPTTPFSDDLLNLFPCCSFFLFLFGSAASWWLYYLNPFRKRWRFVCLIHPTMVSRSTVLTMVRSAASNRLEPHATTTHQTVWKRGHASRGSVGEKIQVIPGFKTGTGMS